MIFEEIVEYYRKLFVKTSTLPKKDAARQARENIKEWMNKKDSNGYTPIFYASATGDSGILRLLEKYGALFNVKNNYGLSPMHFAAKSDSAFSITFLKNRGIDPEITSDDG